jgi:hypothetical protein
MELSRWIESMQNVAPGTLMSRMILFVILVPLHEIREIHNMAENHHLVGVKRFADIVQKTYSGFRNQSTGA